MFFGGTKHVVLNLPTKYVYGFKYYVRTDYRGRKIGQAVSSLRLNYAKREGLNFVTAINSFNKVSRHTSQKKGGYPIGSIIFLKSYFCNVVIPTPGVKREGFKIISMSDY